MADALEHFERAARLGFRLAEADAGFTYMQARGPTQSDRLAYAWLSLAKSRPGINEAQRKMLERSLAELTTRLKRSGQLEPARGDARRIGDELSSVAAWSDR